MATESTLQSGAVEAAPQHARADTVALIIRLILGGVFIYMGAHKVAHPIEFLKLVKQYELVSGPPWLNIIAATLPWFEILCGLLLLAGIAVRGTAINVILMLVPFSIIVLRRALEISRSDALPFTSVKFDCGCGGGEVVIWTKLIENVALILLALWLAGRQSGRLSARFTLLRG